MAFIPHTQADVAAMLEAIGVARIEDLFDEIPQELRVKSLAGIPEALNEMQIGRLMSERARADGTALSFLGAGAYEHHIPAAVWAITTRGEFYSAYTPYQAEASQGTLQLIYEFQTMMARLTGHGGRQRLDVRRRLRHGGSGTDGGARQPQVARGADPGADQRASALPQGRARPRPPTRA